MNFAHAPLFNKLLLAVLRDLNHILKKSPLQAESEEISLISGNKKLIRITSSDILLGEHSFQEEIVGTSNGKDIQIKENFSSFLKSISGSVMRLNHMGVSYFCENMSTEIVKMKKVTERNGLPLYEEISGNPMQRWLFTGDIKDRQSPLFEIVLNKGKKIQGDYWRPHFQIDIDTSMTIEQIKKATDNYLGKEFVKWQMDIPDYGTVLAMGILGEVNGAKIALGIGTTLRETEYHRKNLLKPL